MGQALRFRRQKAKANGIFHNHKIFWEAYRMVQVNINNEQMVGQGVGFERIRRITGYLVGTLDRFNDAKRAEVGERVKHTVSREVKL
ncbi:hypothetical protein ANACOL_03873 [Anaerotruncus colihominis DSM 17241]|uniref:Uncharacterized protein n=2 Tax=Anaerotruncus colihominis TaxID=169435 RepID=B0PGE0_9FIRM|nr:hypothetical protein ANACOL_03873 [Anaerotruncus colihominis DSM 17241]